MAVYLSLPELKASLANAGGVGARTAANLPDPRLQAHLDDATSTVLGRLARNFTVAAPDADPVPAGIDTLKGVISDVAAYTATLEYFGSQPVEERDPIVLRYQRALALLEQIAKGLIRLPGIEDSSSGAVTGDAAIYQGTPAVNLTNEAPLPGSGYWPAGGVGWWA